MYVVFMYVCINVYVCIYYVCLHVCMRACMYVCMYNTPDANLHINFEATFQIKHASIG